MKKYFIITYGCQMNESDSLRLGQYLNSRGWSQAYDVSEADLIFFNACSVRQSAVDRLYFKVKSLKHAPSEVEELKVKSSQIILVGCVLPKDKEKFLKLGIKIRRIEQLPLRISRHSEPSPRGEAKNLGRRRCQPIMDRDSSASFGARPQNDTGVAYVPIMRGCNNWCSYCAVPLTKGRERCRPTAKLIAEVKRLVATGHKKITLLGQNVNSYCSVIASRDLRGRGVAISKHIPPQNPGLPRRSRWSLLAMTNHSSSQNTLKIDFADLLNIINNIPGNFKVRFLTNHPKDMSDKLIQAIAQCDKVIKEIHLPFQSGDDTILKAMNRHYTKQYYLDLVKKIKLIIPNVKITTDIIVGFPGETEKQFQETIDTVKKVGFFKAYISKYSPRLGTVASHLADNIPMAEKKRREQVLRQLIR